MLKNKPLKISVISLLILILSLISVNGNVQFIDNTPLGKLMITSEQVSSLDTLAVISFPKGRSFRPGEPGRIEVTSTINDPPGLATLSVARGGTFVFANTPTDFTGACSSYPCTLKLGMGFTAPKEIGTYTVAFGLRDKAGTRLLDSATHSFNVFNDAPTQVSSKCPLTNGGYYCSSDNRVICNNNYESVTCPSDKTCFQKSADYVYCKSNTAASETLINDAPSQTSVGLLKILTDPPGANIFIDDKPFGQINTNLALNPGTYSIKIVKSGFIPVTETVNIIDKHTTTLDIKLQPLDQGCSSIDKNSCSSYAGCEEGFFGCGGTPTNPDIPTAFDTTPVDPTSKRINREWILIVGLSLIAIILIWFFFFKKKR